jgi:flagellar hook-basal body complex protein FliE
MSIDPISAIGAAAGGTELARAQPASTAQVDFTRWMSGQLSEVNQQIGVAEQALGRLATGDGNLHQVMLDLEKARTAFQLTLQVRNKVIESYQEILRMQV